MSSERGRGLPIWGHLLLALLVLALLQGFVVRMYKVPSASMEPTLAVGQRILVDRLTPHWSPIADGDVVVFRADPEWTGEPARSITGPVSLIRWTLGLVGVGPGLDHALVKRVIGTPGQTVACCDPQGRVQVDGLGIDEPHVVSDLPFTAGTLDCSSTPRSPRCFDAVTVPPDGYLVLGDNRADSADSVQRCRSATARVGCARFARDVVGRVTGT